MPRLRERYADSAVGLRSVLDGCPDLECGLDQRQSQAVALAEERERLPISRPRPLDELRPDERFGNFEFADAALNSKVLPALHPCLPLPQYAVIESHWSGLRRATES